MHTHLSNTGETKTAPICSALRPVFQQREAVPPPPVLASSVLFGAPYYTLHRSAKPTYRAYHKTRAFGGTAFSRQPLFQDKASPSGKSAVWGLDCTQAGEGGGRSWTRAQTAAPSFTPAGWRALPAGLPPAPAWREAGRSRCSSAPQGAVRGAAQRQRGRAGQPPRSAVPMPGRPGRGCPFASRRAWTVPSAGSRSPFYIIGRTAAAEVTQQRGERGLPARLGGTCGVPAGQGAAADPPAPPPARSRLCPSAEGGGGGGVRGARPGPASRPLRPTASPARARGSPPPPPPHHHRAGLAAPP